jgi:hypothetical protein
MIADLYRLYPGRWNKIKILRSLSLSIRLNAGQLRLLLLLLP